MGGDAAMHSKSDDALLLENTGMLLQLTFFLTWVQVFVIVSLPLLFVVLVATTLIALSGKEKDPPAQ
jgi:hypothetical protein